MKMQFYTLPIVVVAAALVSACSPSNAVQEYASENTVSFRYSAYDSVPTLTAEARDKAAKHCAQYGKYANYQGGNAANAWTAEEIHTFACEDFKTNDGAVVAGQSDRPDFVYVPVQTYVYN